MAPHRVAVPIPDLTWLYLQEPHVSDKLIASKPNASFQKMFSTLLLFWRHLIGWSLIWHPN